MRDPWLLSAPAAAWTARRNPGYAADVLRYTACGACSLGSEGLSDDVRPGLHLCRRRLRDLPRLLAEPMPEGALRRADLLDRPGLRALGRLTRPLLRRPGGIFSPLSWQDATHLVTRRLREHRGRWALHVGDEDLSDEDGAALVRAADGLGAVGITRRGAILEPWAQATQARIGRRRLPTSLRAIPTAPRVVIWGDVLSSHPELLRWLEGVADVLCVGASLPGHRRLEGDPKTLARRAVAAAWRHRPPELDLGAPPPVVPEPALAEPALHLVDARLPPEPLLALGLLHGALHRSDTGLLVLGGHPGLADAGLNPRGATDGASAVVCVGATRPAPEATFRAHLGWFLEPEAMLEPRGEVLLLPLRWRVEAEGGATTTRADGEAWFSPQILGHDVGEARALPRVVADLLAAT